MEEGRDDARFGHRGTLSGVGASGESSLPAAAAPPLDSRWTGIAALVAAAAARLNGTRQPPRREWWPRVVFALVAALLLGGMAVMLFPSIRLPLPHALPDRHQELDEHFALLVMFACALPPLLAWPSYLLINKRAVCQHIRPVMPSTIESPALRHAAMSAWVYEMGRAQWSLARAEVFAGIWGMIATVSIIGSVTFLLPPFHKIGEPFHGQHSVVAMAVIGATATSFLLDFARLCVRAANDDATKRMFAESLRTLILSVVSTLALVLLIWVIGPEQLRGVLFDKQGVEACLVALGVGAGVAVVGPPAFDWIQARVDTLIGIKSKRATGGTPLDALGDLSDAEVSRLAEEGIQSVEALVSSPIPRLYLNTRFSLRRIADWHDAGILIVRIGAATAADLRARWGICGAVEIRRIVNDSDRVAGLGVLRGIFKKIMRVDSDPEAELAVRQIADDQRTALTDALRQTEIESDDFQSSTPDQINVTNSYARVATTSACSAAASAPGGRAS